jgi:Kef-type K+ transport system membrane component KefB
MNVLLLLGSTLLLTTVSSFACKRLKLPQVIGHLMIGIVLGTSLLNMISPSIITDLTMVTYFALALIGFSIGGELRWARIKRFGLSILIITAFESIVSCVMVFLGVYALTKQLGLALLLGGLACATAPGGTTNVIQEYKSRGPLTSTLYGVVGGDDALAIILFSFLSGFAKVAIGAVDSLSVGTILGHVFMDIGGAIIWGGLLGLVFALWLLRIRNTEARAVLILVSILLCAGAAVYMNVSLILASMAMGIVIGNIHPHRARSYFNSLDGLSNPVYMVFFVLIGARLNISLIPTMGAIGITYFLFRTFGKYTGAFVGAYVAKTPAKIRQNIGLCLFSQAGVAIGLAISLDIEFANYGPLVQDVSQLILMVITSSTLIFQIMGPLMTKYALTKANETHVY